MFRALNCLISLFCITWLEEQSSQTLAHGPDEMQQGPAGKQRQELLEDALAKGGGYSKTHSSSTLGKDSDKVVKKNQGSDLVANFWI